MVAMVVIQTVALIVLGGVVGWQRYTIRRLMLERVKNAESLLLGTVEVDGHVLPSPMDDRWAASAPITLEKSGDTAVLAIGSVRACETGHVLIAGAKTLSPTTEMSTYATGVWREYRNRLVKKELA